MSFVIGTHTFLPLIMSTYAEKLRSPLWQRKRLEILSRDNFTCQHCKDTETELHVHHKSYNGNPWDADDSDLITMCKHCHYVVEKFGVNSKIVATKLFSKTGIACLVIRSDAGYMAYAFYKDGVFGHQMFIPNLLVNHFIETHHKELSGDE